MPTYLRTLILAILIALTMSVAVSLPAEAGSRRNQRIKHAVSIALNQIGDPYVYGADGPRSFDCSGLMQFSFNRAGIRLPRTSRAQASVTRRIPKRSLRRGDLMFFHSGGSVYHVAMFLRWRDGRARMVHSPRPGSRVHRETAWTRSWFAGTLRRR